MVAVDKAMNLEITRLKQAIASLEKGLADLKFVMCKYLEKDNIDISIESGYVTYDKIARLKLYIPIDTFMESLHDVCVKIPYFAYTFGRPLVPLPDVIFSLTLKSYVNTSYRKMMVYLNRAKEMGYISHLASYNSLARYMHSPTLTQFLLETLNIKDTEMAKITDNEMLFRMLSNQIVQDTDNKQMNKEIVNGKS